MIKNSNKPEVISLSAKVVQKLVRVQTVDGRDFLAVFGSVDKTGASFFQDTLEIIPTEFENPDNKQMRHDCYTPYVLNYSGVEKFVYKYLGNVVIKREHIKKILLDKKSNEIFEMMKEKVRNNEFINY